jgi:hypothetical protein
MPVDDEGRPLLRDNPNPAAGRTREERRDDWEDTTAIVGWSVAIKLTIGAMALLGTTVLSAGPYSAAPCLLLLSWFVKGWCKAVSRKVARKQARRERDRKFHQRALAWFQCPSKEMKA